jgi:hypothetical protein
MQSDYYTPRQTSLVVNENTGTMQYVGSYRDNVIIRVSGEKYLPFMAEIITVSSLNHLETIDVINKYKCSRNIIIEDDGKIPIIVALEMLGENFIIYSITSRICFTIYEYMAKTYEILPYALNLTQIKQLLKAHVLFTTSFKNSQLYWNLKFMLETITDNGYELFYVNIKNYFDKMTNRSIYTTNKMMFKKLLAYVNKYFTNNIMNCTEPFTQFELEHVTTNDLYQVITCLVQSSG